MKQAVILAAGESSRFWPLNSNHKTLFNIMGRPLIYYTIKSLISAGIKDIIVVDGPKGEVEKRLSKCDLDVKIRYIVQPEPKGMGNALLYAKEYINEQFFVLNAERFDAGNYIKQIIDKYRETNSKLVLLGAETDNAQLYGIISFEGDKIRGIIEKPEKGKEPSNIKVVGIYFLPKEFFSYYEKIKEHMYAFEESLDMYAKENDARWILTKESTPFLKYPWHVFEVNKYLMDNYLDKKISKTSKISKNAIIEGKVFIGDNVRIFENAVIKGPCYIGNNCVIGNNALIRDYTNLEADSLVGANIELARAIFEKDVHVHSGFIGDSIFGEGCRIGAGAVTANVRTDRGQIKCMVKGEKISTGAKSLGLFMGQNSKAGIHCSFMPGVFIGSNCNIGPGSVVFKNIENNTDFYTKFEVINEKR